MSTNVLSPGITLSILNPEKLLHGSEPRYRFDRAGGSIGSQGDWRLQDRGDRILPVHCAIGWHEGHFCIIDHSGKSFMNTGTARAIRRDVCLAYRSPPESTIHVVIHDGGLPRSRRDVVQRLSLQ